MERGREYVMVALSFSQAFTPDVMEPVEIRAFPEFYRVYETQGKWHCPRLEIYCLMRNLILGLWFQNSKVGIRVLMSWCELIFFRNI